jgi:hypothetical protein
VIDIVTIEDHINFLGMLKILGIVDFMLFAFTQINKGRQVAINIESDMELGAPLFF